MDPKAKRALCFARCFIRLQYVRHAGLQAFTKRGRPNLRYFSACARGATLNQLEPDLKPSETNVQSQLIDDSDEESFFHPSASFESLGLSSQFCESLKSAGIMRPTHVQVETIPRLLNGLECQIEYAQTLRAAEKEHEEQESLHDPESGEMKTFEPPDPPERDVDDVLMVGAETGSGKTLSYLLPFIEAMRRHPDADVKAVVLQPTRELCAQTLRLLHSYVPAAPRALVLSGGSLPDVHDLKNVRIYIATPAALRQYVNFSTAALRNDKYIVVDEADMLLSGSFLSEVSHILAQPSMKPFATRRNSQRGNRNRLVFVAATYPHWVGTRVKSVVTWAAARYPALRATHTAQIHRRSERIASTWRLVQDDDDRLEALCALLADAGPRGEKVMVFAASASRADELNTAVRTRDPALCEAFGDAVTLHKKALPRDRADALRRFAADEARLLFCTDVASRGLDLGRVTRVVEYDFATNVVAHLHRIGRTARAGASGHTDHFYDDVSKPLVDAIRARDERDENVVDGVFSRKRSFRRKLKKALREADGGDLTEET